MTRIVVDPFGPHQAPITKADIEEMISKQPRRKRLAPPEWPRALYAPETPGKDWRLVLPFGETFKNAFKMCKEWNVTFGATNDRPWAFLRGTAGTVAAPQAVVEWVAKVGKYVALRDCLALSFALDYDRIDGNPANAQTVIGKLRGRAKKPNDKRPSSDTLAAADELVTPCMEFLDTMSCYDAADCVVAVPPSRINKPFDLPTHIVAAVAKARNLEARTKFVRTIKDRPSIKDALLQQKLASLEGTIEVTPGSFEGKTVLVMDDL